MNAAAGAKLKHKGYCLLRNGRLYPGLTTKIFQGVACRDLGHDQSVLLVDYNVDCTTAGYYSFHILK